VLVLCCGGGAAAIEELVSQVFDLRTGEEAQRSESSRKCFAGKAYGALAVQDIKKKTKR